jgi:hypothetical protein
MVLEYLSGTVHPNKINIGDYVLVKNDTIKPKKCPQYSPQVYCVIAIKGTMITVQHKDKIITRNCTLLKKLAPNLKEQIINKEIKSIESESDDELDFTQIW